MTSLEIKNFNWSCWNASNHGKRRHIFNDNRISANIRALPHCKSAQYFSASPNNYILANMWNVRFEILVFNFFRADSYLMQNSNPIINLNE